MYFYENQANCYYFDEAARLDKSTADRAVELALLFLVSTSFNLRS